MAATTATTPYIWGTGRRKTAVARVRVQEGTGKFLVNGIESDAYFNTEAERGTARAALYVTEMGGRVDVFVNVTGSGKNGQAGAILMGLARALKEFRSDLEPALRESGFLSRDARMVERKKYGHKKARRSYQFSKR
jgi:small subunit ribosomal protein S9